MVHLFINALGASAGGGLTYIRNVLPALARRDKVRATVLLRGELFGEIQASARIHSIEADCPSSSVRRFWYEQRELPDRIHKSGADVLLSAGNFALFRSPVPQILLSRNALYTSADFLCDLRNRGDYRLWLDTELRGLLARWSVRLADVTVAPSAGFASDLSQSTGKNVAIIHHGFDRDLFFADGTPLSKEVQGLIDKTRGSLRLLFVSHYNYYRNFETLIRAVDILRSRLVSRTVRLILTCKLDGKERLGDYNASTAAALVQRLGLRNEVVELGAIPYSALHHLFRACDLYVTPAYAETFAHPLVEAMASGLPVVASDIPVHREICGGCARYFSRFSPESLAETIMRTTDTAEELETMREMGLRRSRDFSWDLHVDQLLSVARGITGT